MFESKNLLLNLVKNHRKWLTMPNFWAGVSKSKIESIAFFLAQTTRVDDLVPFQLVVSQDNKPCNQLIKSLVLASLHNFSKGNFFEFLRFLSAHATLSSVLNDDHSRTLVLEECLLYFQKTSLENISFVVRALAGLARSGFLIENMHRVFAHRAQDENVCIMESFFWFSSSASNDFLKHFQDVIMRENPNFFFQKTGKFARNLPAIHSLLVKVDQLFRASYENINFMAMAKDQSFMLSLLEIPNIGKKLFNSYQNFRLYGSTSNLWYFSMVRCILSNRRWVLFY